MSKLLSDIAAIAIVLACSSLAGAEQLKVADDEIALGAVQGFADEPTARQACTPDGIVWADRKTGFYYPRFAPEYGTSKNGVFTCLKQAKAADYWGFGPAALLSDRGRVFPLVPGPSCDYKVDKQGRGFCAEPGT